MGTTELRWAQGELHPAPHPSTPQLSIPTSRTSPLLSRTQLTTKGRNSTRSERRLLTSNMKLKSYSSGLVSRWQLFGTSAAGAL